MRKKALAVVFYCLSYTFSFCDLSYAAKSLIFEKGETLYSGTDPNQLIGSYHQPRWTAERLFPETRAYLIPQHELQTEFWTTARVDRSDGDTDWFFQQQIEYGIYRHVELDFYLNEALPNIPGSRFRMDGVQVEVRWALADWGEIFLNPTLYFEFNPRFNNPSQIELRLLMAQQLAPNWHFASNLKFAFELSGTLMREYVGLVAVSRSLIKNYLSAGIEFKAQWSDTLATRGSLYDEYYIGPTIQWKFHGRTHLDLLALIGINKGSHATETIAVFGIDWL